MDAGLRDYIIRQALRYDTAMARAFLRACGVDVPHASRPGAIARIDRCGGIAECMGQRYGVRGL